MNPDRRVLDSLEVGVLVYDDAGRIRYANARAREVLGFDDKELLERTSLDEAGAMIRPDGSPLPGSEHPASRVLRTREAVRGVVLGLWRPATEDRIWILVDAVPEGDEDRSDFRVVVTIRDLGRGLAGFRERRDLDAGLEQVVAARAAEWKRVTEALRRSESNYRAVIRAMAEGVAIHDETGFITSANPAAEAILGLTLEQMQGRHPVDPRWRLTRPDASPLPAEEIPSEVTQRTGQPCTNTLLGVHRPDGGRAWLSVNTDPVLFEGDPKPRGVVSTFTDVTVEREALEEVRASRARLERMTEAVPGVLMESRLCWDGSESFSMISRRSAEILGVPADAARADAEAVWSRLHPEDRPRFCAARARAIAEEAALDQEVRFGPFDGEWRWIRLCSAPPTAAPDGHVIRSLALDVTAQRRLAASLRDAQRRESLGRLAAGVAHNFNNMLAAILPNLESVLAKAPAELREELEDAAHAARDASDLVHKILRATRQETEETSDRADLREVVDDVLHLCARTFDRRVAVDASVPREPVYVPGRRTDLEQVILNLAINARDALEHVAEPRLHLSLEREGDFAVLRVTDNGSGMGPSTLERLGEPFFTTKEPGRGTGLGVATAVGTLEDLGGSLRWESALGRGSRFEARLPLARLESVAPALPAARASEPLAGEVVLLVDDEDVVRRTLVRLLERIGVEVLGAADGANALLLLDAHPEVSAAIVDLSMPGMSGEELLQRIRAARVDLPVLILSGHAPRKEGVLATANRVLQKPIGLLDLREALTSALRPPE